MNEDFVKSVSKVVHAGATVTFSWPAPQWPVGAHEVMNMSEATSDEEVVKKVLQGETALYEVLVHRYNQRLYRICRAILRNNSEARDVVQHTHAQAYEHLNQFAGRAKFSTWLTTIAINEASLRRRRSSRFDSLEEESTREHCEAAPPSPEEQFSLAETRQILESLIDALPEKYRLVQVMRDVEEMSVAETAECLGISPENVKVRLHRARALLRKRLYKLFGSKVSDMFRFHLSRCDRVVYSVSERTRLYQNTRMSTKILSLNVGHALPWTWAIHWF
jgi:RNA polymerase sigma-70 factor, ECF subfamily